MRVVLHTGKGGVGKTSLALATALRAAEHGHRVFVLSADPAHSIGDALGRRLGQSPVRICEGVVVQQASALSELERSWSEIQSFLRQLMRAEADAMIAEELLVFPGLEELIALRGIGTAEACGEFDLCVVDCAPTGATLRMLRFPDALRVFMEHFFDLERRGAKLLRPLARRLGGEGLLPGDEFFDAFEHLYSDVDDVRQILLDGGRTSARLVVNAERVVVDETRRAFAYLSLYGVATDAVLVNRLLPEEASGGYFARWAELQESELRRIEAAFPIPRFQAPLLGSEPIGIEALQDLGRRTFGQTDPALIQTEVRPISLRKAGADTDLEIALPGVSKEEVEVKVVGADLHVRARDAERLIALPDSLQRLALSSVRLREGVLRLRFSQPA